MATWCLYGSPETVIGKLRAYQELGIGNILCGTVTGPLTEKRLAYADQTLRLLAERVMPAFK
jgi:alkanesulfonate monooxygenase SsuD/methylene tetrahydromethanopterin reductase-like flavin-dependent oxidoreductase (luciferase family)